MKEAKQVKRFPIMLGLLLGGFVGMFSETALNIAMSSLATQLSVPIATLQWLVIGYLLIVGVLSPLSSFLTRWFTTRQLLIFALLDFIVGAAVAALAPNFVVLFIGRMIQGIATGILLPLIYLVVLSIYPMEKRGSAMGIVGLVVMFATAVGPTLAGIILGTLNWRFIFWLMIPILLVALILATIFTKNVSQITKPEVDIVSILTSTTGFGGIVIGVSFSSITGWLSLPVVSWILIGIASLIIFFYRQLRLEEPILNIRAFAFRKFSIGTILVLIDFMVIMSSVFLLPLYWQVGLLAPVAITGLLLLPGGLVNAFIASLAGRMFDRFGGKLPVVTGFLISSIGAFLLIISSENSQYWYVVLAHIVIMVGVSLVLSPAQTYGLNALPKQFAADGSSIMNTFQQISGAIATALATSLLSFGEAGQQTRHAITNGSRLGFMLTFGLAVIGLFISLIAMRKRSINVPQQADKNGESVTVNEASKRACLVK